MRSILYFVMLPFVAATLAAGELEPPVLPPFPPLATFPKGASAASGPLKTPVEKMVLSPDGTRIALGGSGGRVHILDSATLHVLKDFDTGPVAGIDFSADGKDVLCAGPGNDILLWNLDTGKSTRTFSGHTGEVCAVMCSPDGSRVAGTDSAGTLRIWNFSDAKCLFTLTAKKFPEDPPTETLSIEGLAFSPDGRFIVTEANDAKARVWDAVRGVELRVVRDHDGKTASVSTSPSGTLAASSRGGGLLRLWKLENGSVVRVFSGHEADVTCSVFATDECTVFSGAEDKTVRQWDVETGLELRRFTLGANPTALLTSTDGRRLYALSSDAGVSAWDPASVPLTHGKFDDVVTSLNAAWLAMSSNDYDARTAGVCFLLNAKDSAAAIQFILGKLNSGGIPTEERKTQDELVAKLDDPAYATRLKAAEDIKRLGLAAREALTHALKHSSNEVRARAADLLRDMGGAVDARGVLAIEIFGLMHSPESKVALSAIAAQDGPNAARAKAMLAAKEPRPQGSGR